MSDIIEVPAGEVPAGASYTCERCGTEYAEGDSCPACGALRDAVPADDDPTRTARWRCVLCGRALADEPEGGDPARCAEHSLTGRATIACTLGPVNGASPTSISYVTAPSA